MIRDKPLDPKDLFRKYTENKHLEDFMGDAELESEEFVDCFDLSFNDEKKLSIIADDKASFKPAKCELLHVKIFVKNKKKLFGSNNKPHHFKGCPACEGVTNVHSYCSSCRKKS